MIPFERPEWFDDAACRGLDPDLFFPQVGEMATQAKQVCSTCSVRSACLEFAVTRAEHHGVWGGLSERERQRIRARRSLAPRRCQWSACGATFQPQGASQWYCDISHQRAAASARKVAKTRRAG